MPSLNFICHADGGTRVGRCSAAAWLIEAVQLQGGTYHTFPVARAGIYMPEPISALEAEAIALSEVVCALARLAAKCAERI